MDQYLLLAKGARGRAVVDLIHRAVSDPAVFAFGELLDVQSVREVSHPNDGLAAYHASVTLMHVLSMTSTARVTCNERTRVSASGLKVYGTARESMLSVAEAYVFWICSHTDCCSHPAQCMPVGPMVALQQNIMSGKQTHFTH